MKSFIFNHLAYFLFCGIVLLHYIEYGGSVFFHIAIVIILTSREITIHQLNTHNELLEKFMKGKKYDGA